MDCNLSPEEMAAQVLKWSTAQIEKLLASQPEGVLKAPNFTLDAELFRQLLNIMRQYFEGKVFKLKAEQQQTRVSSLAGGSDPVAYWELVKEHVAAQNESF